MAKFAPDHTITFGSMSKNFAMTGWRLGYMIAPTYLNEAAKIINEGITYSAPTPSQRAAIYALNHSETLIPLVAETFQKRLEYIAKRVEKFHIFLYIHLKVRFTPLSTFLKQTWIPFHLQNMC